ncbi:MAG TPA: single-stranded DNA-binding protein [Bacteroidales bacterium]|nr:single-stranded DNA-binding protein [Bacteroidales bacterium]
MSSVNKVILIGNAGQDPDVRYLDRGVAIANFPLATTERGYTMQNGTQVPDRTEWHNIVLWRNMAEWAEKNLRKGMKVYVEGHLQTRTWEKEGIRRNKTEIIAENIMILHRPERTQNQPSGAEEPLANDGATSSGDLSDGLPNTESDFLI